MTGSPSYTATRRTVLSGAGGAVLSGAGVACAATLAGCARYDANNGGLAGAAASATGPDEAVLASTSDVPVGGGLILAGKKIVITQPRAGSFGAFTAVCTHQGCIVATVSGGTINCPCHGSKFSIANGSVVNGPATTALAPVSIAVKGASIIQD
jgi:Rieske Fe-S protein